VDEHARVVRAVVGVTTEVPPLVDDEHALAGVACETFREDAPANPAPTIK
jgi:hypothetical protein